MAGKKKSPGNSPGKKGSKGKGKKGKSKATEEPVQEVPQEEPKEKKVVPEPPPGVVPLFFTTQTQQIFNILADVNVSRASPNTVLTKNAILEDIGTRKAFSDFHPISGLIAGYPGEEVLVVYDADFVFGENFYVCVTEEAKENILFPPSAEEAEEDPFALPDIPYIPPEPKSWQNLGSDVEVTNENVVELRPKLNLSIMKPRRYFSEKCMFSNRDADAGKDSYQECLPNYERRNIVCRKELDKGTQAVPGEEVKTVQTDYRKPLNQWSQYVPRELTEEDKGEVIESDSMGRFVKDVTPVIEAALQQNEIINVFRNDWEQLNPGKSMMSERQETYLKEYQSFQDLHYSKDKQIICEDWHTMISGAVGVSCVEQMSYDVRLRNMSRIMMVPSLVLLWNYQDPIHPRLLLESPDDCFVFRFNPINPNIVAGGCMSGRIVIWDLTQYYGRLAMTESSIQMKKLSFLSSLVEDTEGKIPVVQPVASTHIDFGHSSCVTDLQWLVPPYVVDRQGRVTEDSVRPDDEECHQIISCAGDDHFLVWDITPQRPRRGQMGAAPDTESQEKDRWQLLSHNWRPVVRIFLPSRADGIPYSLCQFRLKNAIKEPKGEEKEEDSGEKKNASPPETTDDAKSSIRIYAGTQSGDVLFTDLRVKRDSDTNRTVLCELHEQQVHAAPIRSICISPFFDDMVLTVGGFRFAIWKVGIKWEPLMVSAEAPARRTSGAWSLSRPSMFFIGRQDGSVEVWDILDRAQEPLLSQNLSGVEVTNLNIKKLGRRQVLSVSDNSGNLHLLEIPLVLTQLDGDEQQMLENLFKRETKRADILREKRTGRQAAKKKTSDAPQPQAAESPEKSPLHPEGANVTVQMADDDADGRSDYDGYLQTERKLVNQLAGVKDSEPNVAASGV